MLRGIDRPIQREIIKRVDLINISQRDYQLRMSVDGALPNFTDEVWLKQLRSYRQRLEDAWSQRTVHPSYLGDKFDPTSSRGQCGVSSVWLARELHVSHSVKTTYCYGDLLFPGSRSKPVKHHCWLEMGSAGDPSRLVIDLTCDQADDLDEPVLCAPHDKLLAQGLNYVSHTRSDFDDLTQDRVWYRYEQLIDAMADGIESAHEVS
jgi:hypothetical protein